MDKFKLLTAKKVLTGIALVAIVTLYHTGVKGENDCIAQGYNAGYCAKVLD